MAITSWANSTKEGGWKGQMGDRHLLRVAGRTKMGGEGRMRRGELLHSSSPLSAWAVDNERYLPFTHNVDMQRWGM